MTPDHAMFGGSVKTLLGLAIVAFGILALTWPDDFVGIRGYFDRSAGKLPPDERERLVRTVIARQEAEGVRTSYGRWLGLLCIAMGALMLLPSVPFVAPYALLCLAAAVVKVLGYLQFRRESARRAAPLVPRTMTRALPLAAVAAMACSFGAIVTFAILPTLRIGAIAGAVATLVLAVIAWRVACAPALLLGLDPQAEYAVDERVREVRATGIAALACAPMFVLAMTISPESIAGHGSLSVVLGVAKLIGSLAFVVVVVESTLLSHKRIRIA